VVRHLRHGWVVFDVAVGDSFEQQPAGVEQGQGRSFDQRKVSRNFFLHIHTHTNMCMRSSQLDIGETKAALLDIVHCYEFDMLGEDKMKKDGRAMFYLLQQWYSNISEFDYLVEANSVVILDHPFSAETTIEELLAFWGTVAVDVVGTLNEKSKKTSFGGGNVGKPTFSSFKRNHDLLRPPDTNLPKYQQHTRRASLFTDSSSPLKTLEKKRLNSNSSNANANPNANANANAISEEVTWTVLVSGMRLLWTLDIRDAVYMLVGDLLHTLDAMKIQKKMDTASTSAALPPPPPPPPNIDCAGASTDAPSDDDMSNDGNGSQNSCSSIGDLKDFDDQLKDEDGNELGIVDSNDSTSINSDTDENLPQVSERARLENTRKHTHPNPNPLDSAQLRAGMYFKSEEDLEEELPESNLLYLLERKNSGVSQASNLKLDRQSNSRSQSRSSFKNLTAGNTNSNIPTNKHGRRTSRSASSSAADEAFRAAEKKRRKDELKDSEEVSERSEASRNGYKHPHFHY